MVIYLNFLKFWTKSNMAVISGTGGRGGGGGTKTKQSCRDFVLSFCLSCENMINLFASPSLLWRQTNYWLTPICIASVINWHAKKFRGPVSKGAVGSLAPMLLKLSPAFSSTFPLAIKLACDHSHHGKIDLNKILGTMKETLQTSKWTPLGSQITEN